MKGDAMFDSTTHPSDETLLRAVDGELSARAGTTLERHLLGCAACRTRQEYLASTGADVSRAYRDEGNVPDVDALRARLRVRMAGLSTPLQDSWRVRVAGHLATLPRGFAIAATLAVLVILARAVGPWSTSGQQDDAAIESASLPIRSVTPGATHQVSVQDICDGRLPSRAPTPATVRQAILRDYGDENLAPAEYELDYLITPELGGTGDRANLWPERYVSPVWNARVKDQLEDLLPRLVCQGTVDLATAQHDIAENWIAAYKTYFRTDHPVERQAYLGADNDDDVLAARGAPVERLVSLTASSGRYRPR
jgi:hypothetical protein